MFNFSYALLLTIALIDCYAGERDVLELNDENFSSRIGESQNTLVMFYAPWSGHCQHLQKSFAKAKELARNDKLPLEFAKVDCTEGGKETCNRLSVSRYPTVIIFKNGEVSHEYEGPRRPGSEIVKYLRSKIASASRNLLTVHDAETFLAVNEPAVFGFFGEETDLKAVFLSTAEKLSEKYRFAQSGAHEVLKKYNENDAIILFRAPYLGNEFEPSSVKFRGSSVEELSEFIANNVHGLVGHREYHTVNDFKLPLVVLYYPLNERGADISDWRNIVFKVAKKFAGKLNFAVSSKDDFKPDLFDYGSHYHTSNKPVILAFEEHNRKFIQEGDFSAEQLQQFAKDLLDNKLEPYIRSETSSKSNDYLVKIAVAKNFDEIGMRNGKDTLIQFYDPQDVNCKILRADYIDLAEMLKNDDIDIVKINAKSNEIPAGFEVTGVPTLFWLPKNSKHKPIKYDGIQQIDYLIKFIAKHATVELNGYDRSGTRKPKKVEL